VPLVSSDIPQGRNYARTYMCDASVEGVLHVPRGGVGVDDEPELGDSTPVVYGGRFLRHL
jgi:hypothetical protein